MTAISATRITASNVSTRALLGAGVLAAPIFAGISLAQATTRTGFDITRHPLSQLSTGSLGWLQITNFIVSGLLTMAGAAGLRRVMRGTPGGRWAPRLIAINGSGMIAAGLFRMDPADGFPAGTPAGQPTSMSWHSYLHMASGTIAFTAMIAACYVLGRHFSRGGQRGAAVASRMAGSIFAAGDLWAMTGGAAGSLTLAIGAITAMAWIAVVCARKA